MFNWGAIGQGVAGTIQSGVGLFQRREAKKLRKKGEAMEAEAWANRTDFEIPEEVTRNLQTAQNEAYGKSQLQSYMEEQADSEQANNLSAVRRYATSSADALAAAGNANLMARRGKQEAAVAGAQERQQDMGRVYEAGNTLADYKSLQWDMNVNMPFLQRLQWSQSLQGAGYGGMQAGLNQFVEGQNQIGESAANFFGGGGGGGGGMGGGMMGGGGGGGNLASSAGGSFQNNPNTMSPPSSFSGMWS